jgi:hypothetical protein
MSILVTRTGTTPLWPPISLVGDRVDPFIVPLCLPLPVNLLFYIFFVVFNLFRSRLYQYNSIYCYSVNDKNRSSFPLKLREIEWATAT